MTQMRLLTILLLVAAGLVLFVAPAGATTYSHEIDHIISGSSDGALTNYQVPITFYNTTGTSSGSNCYLGSDVLTSGFYDIMINGTYANGTDNGHTFPMWVESYGANSAKVWVNVTDTIPQNDDFIIRIYYGNADATNPYNGTRTFTLFDDFNGASVNSSMWTTLSGTGVSVSGGAVAITATSVDGARGIYTATEYGQGYALRARAMSSDVGNVANKWTAIDFADDWSTTTYDAGAQIAQSGSNQGLSVWTQANGTTFVTTTAMQASTYMILETKRAASRTNMTINDANEVSITSNIPTSTTASWRLCARKSGATGTPTLTVDWVALRKYTANEPANDEYFSGPLADFTANTTSGFYPLTVQFTDESTNNPTSWEWNFGDGSSNSTSQNPTHTYTSLGSYTVTLTTSNTGGSSTVAMSNYITITGPITYGKEIDHVIVGSPDADLTNYQVSMTFYNISGTSSGSDCYLGSDIKSPYFYDLMINGSNADGTDDGHTFPMWVESYGTNSAKVWINVTDTIPRNGNRLLKIYYGAEDVVASPFNGTRTFPMFDDFNGGSLNSSMWTTLSGTGVSVSGGAVALTATANGGSPGIYSANDKYAQGYAWRSRVMSSVVGSTTNQWTAMTIINDPSSATYEMGAEISESGMAANLFHWTSTGGTTLTYQPAMYANDYMTLEVKRASSGTKLTVNDSSEVALTTNIPTNSAASVKLTARKDTGATTPTLTVDWVAIRKYAAHEPIHGAYVTNGYPGPGFTADVTGGLIPLTVHFTDNSFGNPTAWQWNFGDGSPNSTSQNASHTYTTAGDYTVTLTVTNAIGSSTLAMPEYINAHGPVNIIYDTDMSEDPGDLAGVHTLNYLVSTGEANALAIIISSSNDYAAPAADAMCNWHYHDIPIGAWKGSMPDGSSDSDWTQTIAENFGKSGLTKADYPDSTTVYRQALAAAPDHSVIIVSGGFAETLQALLESPADGISQLTGGQLVAQKVIYLQASFGGYPDNYGDAHNSFNGATYEFNAKMSPAAYDYICTYWPTPIKIQNFLVGWDVLSAPPLSYSTTTNPLRKAYYIHYDDAYGRGIGSWEQVSLADAVRPDVIDPYLPLGGENGTISIDPVTGYSSWSQTPDSHQSYFDCADDATLGAMMNVIMEYEPGDPINPVASFTGTPTSGYTPLTVQFTDASTGYTSSWQWNFGDGTANSTSQNPSHQYTTPGTYTVMLTAINFNGTSTMVRTNYIGAIATPTPKPPTPTPVILNPILPVGNASFLNEHHLGGFDLFNNLTAYLIQPNMDWIVGNWSNAAGVFVQVYSDNVGENTFWLLLFLIPTIVLWWRSRSPFLPCLLVIIMAPALWSYIPGGVRAPVIGIITVTMVGVAYSFFMGLKKT